MARCRAPSRVASADLRKRAAHPQVRPDPWSAIIKSWATASSSGCSAAMTSRSPITSAGRPCAMRDSANVCRANKCRPSRRRDSTSTKTSSRSANGRPRRRRSACSINAWQAARICRQGFSGEIDQAIELVRIDVVGFDVEHVSGRGGRDHRAFVGPGGLQQAAQLRDLIGDGPHSGIGLCVTPDLFQQPIRRHRFAGMENETGQHCSLPTSRDRPLDAAHLDPDWTQHPDPSTDRDTISMGGGVSDGSLTIHPSTVSEAPAWRYWTESTTRTPWPTSTTPPTTTVGESGMRSTLMADSLSPPM